MFKTKSWGLGRDTEWALGVAEGGGCRDERRGSSASEVGTDDGTAKKKKKVQNTQNETSSHWNQAASLYERIFSYFITSEISKYM